MSRIRYVQHPITFELIPADEYQRPSKSTSAYIIQDSLDGFVADATRVPQYIESRSQLRSYCRDNGLTLSADCQGLPFKKAHEEYDAAAARKQVGALLQKQLFS